MTVLRDAATRAAHYLEAVAERAVAPGADDVARLDDFLATPLGDEPIADAQILAQLDDFGSPATMASAGGRYFGLVIGGALPASVAASYLVTAWDQNAVLRVTSPAAASFEEAALRDLKSILRLPETCEGALVTGATMASFTSLLAARHALIAKQGYDVESQGLFGAPEVPVIVSDDIHPSLTKALGMLGLGRDRVTTLPVDTEGRILPDGLATRIDRPAIVCAQAGNVNTGGSDPFAELADAVARVDGWLHVDGAFGLWAAASPARRHLVEGIERAHSWATDCHKWLNVPYDSGLALVRDGGALRASCSLDAAYLETSERRDPSATGPEFSRRARGVEIWAALQSLGRNGLADLIERTCRHAERFASELQSAGFEILNDVVLNQVLVSFGTDDETDAAINAIQHDGTCWCGVSEWHGRRVMRISVSSWATTEEDVERSLAAIIRCAREAANAG